MKRKRESPAEAKPSPLLFSTRDREQRHMEECIGILSNGILNHDMIFAHGTDISMSGGALLACIDAGPLGRAGPLSIDLPLESDIDLFVRGRVVPSSVTDSIRISGDALCDLLKRFPLGSSFVCDSGSTIQVTVPGCPRVVHIVYAPEVFSVLFRSFDFPFLRMWYDGDKISRCDSYTASCDVQLSAAEQLSPVLVKRAAKYKKRGYSFHAVDQKDLDLRMAAADEASETKSTTATQRHSDVEKCIRGFAFQPSCTASYAQGTVHISPRFTDVVCAAISGIPAAIVETIIAEYCSEFANLDMTASQTGDGVRICRRYAPGQTAAHLLVRDTETEFLRAVEEFVRVLRCTNRYIDSAFQCMGACVEIGSNSCSVDYIDLNNRRAELHIKCQDSRQESRIRSHVHGLGAATSARSD